jgi:hypothetical protein
MKKENKPIFIHSLFRTGSTYIWNKFRQKENYYCYYEPLHPVLAKVTPANIENMMTKNFKAVHHPELDRYYLHEYIPLLKEGQTGIPYFNKEFSYDLFCMGINDENPGLKQYIDYLLSCSVDKIPVFKFNRTAFRTAWFKKNYPGSLNIYLIRNPRDQWQSYCELYKRRNNSLFFLIDLVVASVNKENEEFRPLSRIIPLLHFSSPLQDKENDFYNIILGSYPAEEKYFISYYTWFKAIIKNVLHADFIININLLSRELSYKKKVLEFLKESGIDSINFADAKIEEYSQYTLPVNTMEEIEEKVQNLLIQSLTEEQIDCFFREISPEDKSFFKFDPGDFIRIQKRKKEYYRDFQKEKLNKLEKMIVSLEEPPIPIEKNKSPDVRVIHEEAQIPNMEKRIEGKEVKPREKDLLLLLKDEQLKQKDLIIADNERTISTKNNKIKKKNLQLWEKDEQIKMKAMIIAEKDQELLWKDVEIKEKIIIIAEWSERSKQKDEELKLKDLQLLDMKEQLSYVNRQLQKTFDSWTYRTGKMLIFPAKAVKRLILELKSVGKKAAIFHHTAETVANAPGNYEKKIDLSGQLTADFGRHRSGLKYGLYNLKRLHNPGGVVFDAFIERTFCWDPEGIKPHLVPWIGIIHVPPGIPTWFNYHLSNEMIFKSEAWGKSLPYCKGLFTMSEYHRKHLETQLKIPVNSLFLPTEFPREKWSWEKFTANKKKKLIQVGWWLRKLHAIYQLPGNGYKKIFLNIGHKSLPRLMEMEREILIKEGTFEDSMYDTAETVSFLSNRDYDKLLCENIVFIYLYDASANNIISECIARGTPLLVNPIEPVKEYLGDDYPFYYNSLEEAAGKAMDLDLVYKTHRFLVNHPIKEKLSGEYFLKSIADSLIYRSL